jgi:hypothetical protein
LSVFRIKEYLALMGILGEWDIEIFKLILCGKVQYVGGMKVDPSFAGFELFLGSLYEKLDKLQG